MLAILVAGVVSMMIVPLPTPLLDILLTLNITGAVLILLIALYVSTPLRLATFPSILLISTLFRLALNVSSTRLILLQADAGEVIRSFGQFVVQGNMIVGAVVFAILTLINFIVITKGSERVAEVSARFTLDAMPGKQMSIDSDVRSGAIDVETAKSRRSDLERESQLFGAMDGAMKFVKGDAIAGIVITIVNILGGILIGVLTKDMQVVTALKTYGILTIGDGLVTQIPALIVATSAGLIVTRVAPEHGDAHLGHELSIQLLAHPRAFAITAILLIALGLVPGLPTIPFWLLAAVMAVTSKLSSHARQNSSHAHHESSSPDSTISGTIEPATPITLPVPLALHLSMEISSVLLATPGDIDAFETQLRHVRDCLQLELGVRIPRIMVRLNDPAIESRGYRVFLFESLSEPGSIPLEKCLVRHPPDKLGLPIAEVGSMKEPGGVAPCAVLSVGWIDRIRQLGFPVLEDLDIIGCHIENFIRRHAADLLGLQETKWLCEELERYYPDSVREVIPRCISYARLTDILRRLLREGVSIRNIKLILESLSEWAPIEPDNFLLTEKIRLSLNRQITARAIGERGYLGAFVIAPAIETLIQDSIRFSNGERTLAIEPENLDCLFRTFSQAFQRHRSTEKIVLLTMNSSIRHVLWKLLVADYPQLEVVSIDEITPGTRIVPVRKIQLQEVK